MATKKGRMTAVHRTAQPPGSDNFEFEIVNEFPGYNSAIDPTSAAPGVLIRGAYNVYRKVSGTIANRPGRLLYDATTDSTNAGVKAGFVWNTSLGTIFPLRVANGKLQVESNITGSRVWYDLLTSLTLTRFVFDSWWDNTDKKDKLLMVNGGTNIYDWSGGFALFVSYAANVITLDRSAATAGFASSGTVTINGVDYTYTGISGSTLTGTSDASAAVLNQVVMQKIVTKANSSLTSGPGTEFVNDFLRIVGNQMYLGSYTSRLVYMSKASDYTTFAQSSPRLTGEGDVLTLDDVGKGIGVRQGQAHIFGGTSDLYIVSFSQITVSTTLSEQVNVSKIQLGNQIAALGHEFIDVLADNLIYLDQSHQLRSFGSFRNLFTARATMLSQAVQVELNETVFTGGQVRVISDSRGDLVYITAPNSSYVYVYQERSGLDSVGNVVSERFWQPPQLWGVSRVDSINGNTVGFSNANPQIYQLWDTNQYSDDNPSGTIGYQSVALFAYQNGGRRQGKVVFEKMYYEGYTTSGTQLNTGIYYDYQGASGVQAPSLFPFNTGMNGQNNLFTGLVPPSLGGASLGDNPLGDGLNTALDDQDTLEKFRVITDLTPTDCFEFSPMVYTSVSGDRWELLAMGANMRLSQSEAVEIRK